MASEDDPLDEEGTPQDPGSYRDGRDARGPGAEPRRLSDTFKKALGQGFRSVMSSEEKLRGMVADAMPKELVSYIKTTIDSGKDEVVRIVGNQTRKFLEGIDVSGEVAKLLTSLSFEIKTEIRFIPNDQKVKPDVKMSVRPKKVDRDAAKDKKSDDKPE